MTKKTYVTTRPTARSPLSRAVCPVCSQSVPGHDVAGFWPHQVSPKRGAARCPASGLTLDGAAMLAELRKGRR
jgi:hypothetical protein